MTKIIITLVFTLFFGGYFTLLYRKTEKDPTYAGLFVYAGGLATVGFIFSVLCLIGNIYEYIQN